MSPGTHRPRGPAAVPPSWGAETPWLVLAAALLLSAGALGGAGCGRNDAPLAGPAREHDPSAAAGSEEAADRFRKDRGKMVDDLADIIKDSRVMEAMRRVPRHEFVPSSVRSRSYINTPLPLPENQTISEPEIVGIMTRELELKGGERVLEIGTGSGYQAAVLGELAAEVYTIEIRPALAASARKVLEDLRRRGILHFKKLEVIDGDGFQGYLPAAPYDRIVVTAAPRQVPTELINQLKPGGRMVIPVGDYHQELQLIMKGEDGRLSTKSIVPVRFVPMVGPEEAK